MQAITLKDAKRNLPRLVAQVLADAEPRIVVTDKGEQVVVMPLDEIQFVEGDPVSAVQSGKCGASAAIDHPSGVRRGEGTGVDRGMNLAFTSVAWDDYQWFVQHDRKLVKRIN